MLERSSWAMAPFATMFLTLFNKYPFIYKRVLKLSASFCNNVFNTNHWLYSMNILLFTRKFQNCLLQICCMLELMGNVSSALETYQERNFLTFGNLVKIVGKRGIANFPTFFFRWHLLNPFFHTKNLLKTILKTQ